MAAATRSSLFDGLLRAESGRPDSNRRRPAWEAGILPTELRPRPRHNLGARQLAEKVRAFHILLPGKKTNPAVSQDLLLLVKYADRVLSSSASFRSAPTRQAT